jgi:hypothetical protein
VEFVVDKLAMSQVFSEYSGFPRGMRKHSWLRHFATSRKVAGSSPYEVDFFNLLNSSSHSMALGSTLPLTEMNTSNLPAVKGWLAHKANNLTTNCEPIV